MRDTIAVLLVPVVIVVALIGIFTHCVHRKPEVCHAPTPMHCPVTSDQSMQCVGDDGHEYTCVKEYGDEQLDIFCVVRAP